MRALFDARPGDASRTGIGRYARTVAALLAALPTGHEVLTLGGGSPLELGARTALEEELELPALLEREAVDLYHTPLFHLPAILPCRAVVTIHDAIPLARPELTTPGFARLFDEASESAARAEAVVCPSESAKSDLVRLLGLAAEKVSVVPEAPDPVFRPALPEERARVRREHSLGGDRYVLAVGSLEQRKNPGCLLEALAALGEEAPLAVFAGPAAGFDLDGEARRLNVRVRRLGPIPDSDLVPLLSDAFALVFPSLYEGFGLPIVEAFACETPVLASNASSIPEVAGDAARLFDPLDPGELAQAMRELLRDPERRAELVRRGQARLALFSANRVQGSFAELYTTLARRAAA